jgi:hypothetical protein
MRKFKSIFALLLALSVAVLLPTASAVIEIKNDLSYDPTYCTVNYFDSGNPIYSQGWGRMLNDSDEYAFMLCSVFQPIRWNEEWGAEVDLYNSFVYLKNPTNTDFTVYLYAVSPSGSYRGEVATLVKNSGSSFYKRKFGAGTGYLITYDKGFTFIMAGFPPKYGSNKAYMSNYSIRFVDSDV